MGIVQLGNNFFLDTYIDGRRVRLKGGTTRKEAEEALAAMRTDAIRGTFNLPRRSKVLFRDYAEEYMTNYSEKKKRSPERDRVAFVHILPFFGNNPISKIPKFLIEQYVVKRAAEVKPATVNRELSIIKHMLGRAEEMGLIKTNPARSAKLLPVPPTEHTTLSAEEIDRLLDACPDYFRNVLVAAWNSGMRKGEILKLTWKHVDLINRIIHVTETKTKKDRWIPINDRLFEVLNQLHDGTKSEDDYVFTNRYTGKPFVSFYPLWYKSLRRAGLKRFPFHQTRHHFGSRLVALGVDLVTVKELLGHQSLAMTQRYLHSNPSSHREAVARLDKISRAEKTSHILEVFSGAG